MNDDPHEENTISFAMNQQKRFNVVQRNDLVSIVMRYHNISYIKIDNKLHLFTSWTETRLRLHFSRKHHLSICQLDYFQYYL